MGEDYRNRTARYKGCPDLGAEREAANCKPVDAEYQLNTHARVVGVHEYRHAGPRKRRERQVGRVEILDHVPGTIETAGVIELDEVAVALDRDVIVTEQKNEAAAADHGAQLSVR